MLGGLHFVTPCRYPVNEYFTTVQGEATHAGRPSFFVRLQGCGVGCAWCDTKHTWPLEQIDEVPIADVARKVSPTQTWAAMTPHQIARAAAVSGVNHVVLTGGEPATFNLLPLCQDLEALAYSVQIETSGTQDLHVSSKTWVTVSPKLGMKGGYRVRPSAIARADEIKLPVAIERNITAWDEYVSELPAPARERLEQVDIWLQPVWQAKAALRICVDYAKRRNWRLSLQTHKYANLR